MFTSKKQTIQSPLIFSGQRSALLPYYEKLIPEGFGSLVHVYGAAGSLIANATGVDRIVYNDDESGLAEFVRMCSIEPADSVIARVDGIYERYGLLDALFEEDFAHAFYRLRDHYNEHRDPAELYVLHSCSFNHRIRFNLSGGFNISSGKPDVPFNDLRRRKITDFCSRLQRPGLKLSVSSVSYRDLDIPSGALVVIEPPRLNSASGRGRKWRITHETSLNAWVADLDSQRVKFMILNNVSQNNDSLLFEAFRHGYNVRHVPTSVVTKSGYMCKTQVARNGGGEVVVSNFDFADSVSQAA